MYLTLKERVKEKEAREEEMTLLQRLKEAEMFKEWESQEDDVSKWAVYNECGHNEHSLLCIFSSIWSRLSSDPKSG